MQIFVRSSENYAVEVAQTATVADLKRQINADENEDFFLSFNGAVLDDEEMHLANLGVGDLSSVDVIVRLLGGKVHGSLARAGKVRGQTPKVEKKEKKKKKTGRAKRRMQYRRRFVNVVAGPPGRRRGPNSNM